MAQISVDTFRRKGVIFVVYVVNVLFRKNYIQMSLIAICSITLCFRSPIYHSLDCPGHFIPTCHMAQNLPWRSAHHCHNIDIFVNFHLDSGVPVAAFRILFLSAVPLIVPAAAFEELENNRSLHYEHRKKLRESNDECLKKVITLIAWRRK